VLAHEVLAYEVLAHEVLAHESGGDQGVRCGTPVRFDGAAVGQQLARVLEEDDAVAEQAPSLFREGRDDMGCVPVGRVCARAGGLVLAHLRSPGGTSMRRFGR
jgi:hypothetical protein